MPIYVPILLLIVAVLFGGILFSYVTRDRHPPKAIAVIHGLFAISGIITSIICALQLSILWSAVGVLVLAALGGATLFTWHLQKKPIPKAIAAFHGVFGLLGLSILIVLYYYFS